jgi:hypothetical protein
MLTWGDDYPLHQTPEPIAFAGGDRNFYDRYFFNGGAKDGSNFFAATLGVYPQLDVMDAAFSLLADGRQRNLRASKRLRGERMDLQIGPIAIEVLQPLKKLRVRIRAADFGLEADLLFEGAFAPIQEPRFTRRQGARLFMDYTRMTQAGRWSGALSVDGVTFAMTPAQTWGVRDRSWGVRPVGAPESQPPPEATPPQFYWLWSPCLFDDRAAFFHTNDDAHGKAWNRRGVVQAPGALADFEAPILDWRYHRGSRRLASAFIRYAGEAGPTLLLEPDGRHFYMSGLGYTHPKWGHGRDHGEGEVAYDELLLADLNDAAPEHLHVQALARAVLTENGQERQGFGVLEQLLVGPHAPSRLTALFDGAP